MSAERRKRLGEAAILPPESWTQVLPLDQYFDTTRPLEVDIGCGKGRFLSARAAAHPEVNFLGLDRLLVRLRKTGSKIVRSDLTNVRLLRIEAAYAIEHLLPPNSVTTFYIWFPDPWPKRRHHRRRLFTADFLKALHERLTSHGCVHIATDHQDYFREIMECFVRDDGFDRLETFVPSEEEQTDFEREFLAQGLPIGRASFRRRDRR